MAIRARQTGSAFTAWTFSSDGGEQKILALCQEVAHTSPTPVAPAVPVHPLNYVRPVEIIVPRAINAGQVTLTVLETYDHTIWQTLGGVFPSLKALTDNGDINDLADFFTWMQTDAAVNDLESGSGRSKIQLQRIIRNPNSEYWRLKTFKNAKIVDVRDDEAVAVDTTINPLQITVMYTNIEETLATAEATTIPVPDPVWGA